MSRYAAVWTGDNLSSYRHLAVSIPTSINLALSGIPFNGPDVPGFGGRATKQLAVRFYQATCLFPFLRNHSVQGSPQQEPWAFGDKTLSLLRRYIELRYRLLPYLYQLFIHQEREGAPIVAPLFIDSASPRHLERCSDEFFIGALLGAPVVDAAFQRRVYLPRGRWFCLRTGEWQRGHRTFETRVPLGETPLFVRAAAILPMTPAQNVLAADGGVAPPLDRLSTVDFHLFLERGQTHHFSYTYDDGVTQAYRKGVERTIHLCVQRRGSRVNLECREVGSANLPPLQCRFVIHGMSSARLFVDGVELSLSSRTERFSGRPLRCFVTPTRAFFR